MATTKKSGGRKRATKRASSAKQASNKRASSSAPAGAAKALEETSERIRALNEQIIARSRETGIAYLDAYERALKTIASYQQQIASATEGGRTDWLSNLLKAQADFTREVGETVASFWRESLKRR